MSFEVQRWSTPGIGSVNTYWFDVGHGVVVIDGQRELSKAREVKARIDASGKPIVAAFLTHPHPDHFGGIGVFAPESSAIPLYASRQTRDSIAEDRFGLVAASRTVVGDDFPSDVRLPDSLLEDGTSLLIGSIRIVACELGAGEAECMTALYLPDEEVLFCGDLIEHAMTPYLLEGRSMAWLEQLHDVPSTFPGLRMLYPGHGEPGSPLELVSWQKTYLHEFRRLVEAGRTGDALPPSAEREIEARMNERYPNHHPVAAIPDLLRRNVAPIAAELSA